MLRNRTLQDPFLPNNVHTGLHCLTQQWTTQENIEEHQEFKLFLAPWPMGSISWCSSQNQNWTERCDLDFPDPTHTTLICLVLKSLPDPGKHLDVRQLTSQSRSIPKSSSWHMEHHAFSGQRKSRTWRGKERQDCHVHTDSYWSIEHSRYVLSFVSWLPFYLFTMRAGILRSLSLSHFDLLKHQVSHWLECGRS